jgi:hypothetical protein
MKRAGAVVLGACVLGALMVSPAGADDNKGDVWLTNSPEAGSGHAHVPHLDCTTIYMHGSELDASGTYAIASIPGTGSGATILSGAAWTTPATGDVIGTIDGGTLVDLAVGEDDAVANANQGYHFKLTLSQPGVKHKVFWIECGPGPAPTPALTITKTADAASVTTGADIGFTVTIGVGGSFAEGVVVNDPLPMGAGLDWSISPAYAGQGTCVVDGTAPAQQTLSCTVGDLGASSEQASTVTVHLVSHTAALTAVLDPVTFPNVASVSADGIGPITSSAQVVVNPAAGVAGPDEVAIVLGEQLVGPDVAADQMVLPTALPRTGLPATGLIAPALALLASGLVVTGLARRRIAARR